MEFVDHGIVQLVILQEEFEGRRIELQPFCYAQTTTDGAGGHVTHHTLNRDHVQLLHQRFVVGEQAVNLGRNASGFELLHDEVVELVVHHALAIQLLYSLAIKSRRIVAKQQDQTGGIVRGIDGFCLATIQFSFLFHL